MGEINASAKNDIVKDFRNRNDEMLAKTVKVPYTVLHIIRYSCSYSFSYSFRLLRFRIDEMLAKTICSM